MRLLSTLPLLLTLGLFLSACSDEPPASKPANKQTQAAAESTVPEPKPEPESSPAPEQASEPKKEASLDDPNVVVLVNGVAATKPMYAAFYQQWLRTRKRRETSSNTPQQQMAILNELVNSMLIVQEAEAQGFDKRPEVSIMLNLLRTRAITEMAVADYVRQNPVSEQDLKKLYEERFGTETRKEYKASHILVNTEEEAKGVITELDNGADFIELAKQRTVGPSGPQGGDLGWFGPAQMVKPFADAVDTLEDGSHSKTPVQTQFGWHIILREESRETSPPAFKDVQNELLQEKHREILMGYIGGLRNKADVQIKTPEPSTDMHGGAPTPAAPAE